MAPQAPDLSGRYSTLPKAPGARQPQPMGTPASGPAMSQQRPGHGAGGGRPAAPTPVCLRDETGPLGSRACCWPPRVRPQGRGAAHIKAPPPRATRQRGGIAPSRLQSPHRIQTRHHYKQSAESREKENVERSGFRKPRLVLGSCAQAAGAEGLGRCPRRGSGLRTSSRWAASSRRAADATARGSAGAPLCLTVRSPIQPHPNAPQVGPGARGSPQASNAEGTPGS